MMKWSCFLLILFLVGCAYQQPDIVEPYGIIQPVGGIKILKVDGDRVVDLSGEYILRIRPGNHTFLLGRGHNSHTPVEGTQSPYAQFVLEVEEGKCYWIGPLLKHGLNNLFFGSGFQEVKSWKPSLKKEEPIMEYKKKQPDNAKVANGK